MGSSRFFLVCNRNSYHPLVNREPPGAPCRGASTHVVAPSQRCIVCRNLSENRENEKVRYGSLMGSFGLPVARPFLLCMFEIGRASSRYICIFRSRAMSKYLNPGNV